MSKRKDVLPVEREKLHIQATETVAAGMKAVSVSLSRGISSMGLSRCLKTFDRLNQTDGFDCPSCAWPDPHPSERSSIAEYCENGAKAVADEATTARADAAFFAKHSIEDLLQWSERDLGKAGRLTHPMLKIENEDYYKPIPWSDAFQLIASKLKVCKPDEAVFYTSGRTSNEAAFLYQLFVRMYGTNNLPDCSNMCHESSGVALTEVIGIGKGTVKLEDFYIADLVIVMGQNPGTNHPRMMSALQKTKHNGGKIISINPLPEAGLLNFKNPQQLSGWLGKPTEISDLFLQVKINQDVALLKAIMLLLWQEEMADPGTVFDLKFIKDKCSGYEDFIKSLQEYNISDLVEKSGVPLDKIEEAVLFLKRAKKIIVCWAMGITQHKNGVANIQEIINLLLLKGSMGIPGGGACPVRGHSNVQGDRTMGIWEKLQPQFRDRLEKHFAFTAPEEDGYNTVESLQAMLAGKVRVFISLGGNLLLAGPDTDRIAEGMEQCDLTVMISTKLNRNHLITGRQALILPCLGRTEKDVQSSGEQFVSVENSMGIVHKSQGGLPPASAELMSEPAIVAALAQATLGKGSLYWNYYIEDYDRIRDAIEECIPGFDDYNRRVRNEGGFYLPNGAREQSFHTHDQKANFKVIDLPHWDLQPGEFLLTTIRSHDQFNTTIYDHDDRYRGIYHGRRVLFINPQDASELRFKKGDIVDLCSDYGNVKRWARGFTLVPYDIPPDCLAAYFPETNNLVPLDQYADGSYTPISKSVVVTLHPID